MMFEFMDVTLSFFLEIKSFNFFVKFEVVTVGIRAQLERIRFTSVNSGLKSAAQ